MSAAYASGQLSQHGLTGGGPEAVEGLLDESIRGDLFGFFEGKSALDDLAIKAGWGEGKAITRTLDKMVTTHTAAECMVYTAYNCYRFNCCRIHLYVSYAMAKIQARILPAPSYQN